MTGLKIALEKFFHFQEKPISSFPVHLLPLDIIAHIFSYLSLKQQIIASRACKSWYEAFVKRVRLFNPLAHIPLLLNQGKLEHIFSFSKPSTLIFANKKCIGVVQQEHLTIILDNQRIKTYKHLSHCLSQQASYVFFTSKNDYRKDILTCFDCAKGEIFFQFNLTHSYLEAGLSLFGGGKQKLLACFFLSDSPFTFCTITIDGTFVIWKYEKHELFLLDAWCVFQPDSFIKYRHELKFVSMIGNQILIYGQGKEATCEAGYGPFVHLYSLTEKEVTFLPDSGSGIYRKRTTNKFFIEIAKQANGYQITAYNKEANLEWAIEYEATNTFFCLNPKTSFLEFLTDPNDMWIVLKDGREIVILKTENGKFHSHYRLTDQPLFVKLEDSLLILIFKQEISVIEISTMKEAAFYDWNKGPIVDCIYQKETLYFIYKMKNEEGFESFELCMLSELKTSAEAEPKGIASKPDRKMVKKQASTLKINRYAVLFFAFLLVGSAAWRSFYPWLLIAKKIRRA